MTYVPPSEPMQRYLRSLLSERQYPAWGTTAEERLTALDGALEHRTLDRSQAHNLIDYLKLTAPLDDSSLTSGPPIGVYQHDGEIFVVKLNRTKTGKYVKRLVEISGQRLNEDDERVRIDFEYAPGMLQVIQPDEQMTLEQARPYIIRYGRCLFCGLPLKDATSVERGVGPVCYKRYAPPEAAPTVDDETRARLSDLLAQLGG